MLITEQVATALHKNSLSVRRCGFAAGCEAGLCPAVDIGTKWWAMPSVRAVPLYMGLARTRGIALNQKWINLRRGGAPPHIRRRSRSRSSQVSERLLIFKTVSHIRRRSRSDEVKFRDWLLSPRPCLTSGGEAGAMGSSFSWLLSLRRYLTSGGEAGVDRVKSQNGS